MENLNIPDGKSERPKSLDNEILTFEQIKTPAELLEYLAENIHYGFVGRNNNRTYSPEDEDMDNDFASEYFLQSPTELLNSGHGVCWDITELERDWFAKHGYKFKVFFMMFVKETANNLPTHTFLAYEDNGKWYWFEHAFGEQKGIHEYESLEDLVADVKKKQLDYAMKNAGATIEDYENLRVCEYEAPSLGINAQEFILQATKDKKPLDI